MRSIMTRLERLEESTGATNRRDPISIVCRFICAERKEAIAALVMPIGGTGARTEFKREAGEAEAAFMARVKAYCAELEAKQARH